MSVAIAAGSDVLVTGVLPFSYLPPTIDMVLPSTMDADGVAITVRGSNFGREQDLYKWTAEEAAVAVVIGEHHPVVSKSKCTLN